MGMYSSTNFLPCSRCHKAVLPVFLSPRITIFTAGEKAHRSGKQSRQRQTFTPPRECMHGFLCTDVASVSGEPRELSGVGWPGAPGGTRPWAHVRSLGAPAALLSPRTPTDFLRGRWATPGLCSPERSAPEPGARGAGCARLCRPRDSHVGSHPTFPEPWHLRCRVLQDAGLLKTTLGVTAGSLDSALLAQPVLRSVHVEGWGQCLPRCHRAPGRAGVDSVFLTRSSSRALPSKFSM